MRTRAAHPARFMALPFTPRVRGVSVVGAGEGRGTAMTTRDRIARAIFRQWTAADWEHAGEHTKDQFRAVADAVLAALNEEGE